MKSFRLLPYCLLLVCVNSFSIKIPGDVILGGLFPVHDKGEKNNYCSSNVYDRGLQRVEAMLFAIDEINRRGVLPGMTLGATILDTCSRDTYALNRSLEFVRAALNTMDTSGFECGDGTIPRQKLGQSGPVVGVVGGSYSSVSMQVANLLRLFRIPQISPASTSKALSDKSKYELFARTVPPDTFQAIALVDILQLFNWTYVSTIASEGTYGESGIEVFHRAAADRNICVAVAEKVPDNADARRFDMIVGSLLKKPNAKAVVLFARADDIKGILAAAKRLQLRGRFNWLASDGWGRQTKILEGVEDMAEGALTVELESRKVPGFDEYMSRLTPENNLRNPWFDDYWQEVFSCTLPGNVNPQTLQSTTSIVQVCNPSLRIGRHASYEQDSKIQFVVDAVDAFAYALSALHRDVCQGKPGACPAMQNFDGGEFYSKYLLKVSFIDSAGSEVKFDSQGDGLARYMVMNYQKTEEGHDYKIVGKWYNGLTLNVDEIVWATGVEHSDVPRQPTSVCSLPCKTGEIKIMQQGDTCCWICDRCEPWEYVGDEFSCSDCGSGRWPYDDKMDCYDLEQQYMRWGSSFAIAPICISCIGIFLTLGVIAIFVRNLETPIVKASGRELSFMLLSGILLCYLNTFALLAQPSIVSCFVQRIGVGTGFSLMYSALFTKTNRISRIFDAASRSAKRPEFISPKSQVVITCSLVAVQVAIIAVWMIIEPPGTRFYYPSRSEVILKCRLEDSSFLVSQSYNMFLVVICTVYAVKTRKIPENFNESKFIGFTMYTTCIIWLAFVPLYFGTGNAFQIQITTLCIAISLSATVALICLYSPKVYIIVLHPDKNVRKLTMNTATYKRPPAAAIAAVAVAQASHATETTTTETVKLQILQTINSSHLVVNIAEDSDSRNDDPNEGTVLL